MVVIFFPKYVENLQMRLLEATIKVSLICTLLHGDCMKPAQAFLVTDCHECVKLIFHYFSYLLFVCKIHYTKVCLNVYIFVCKTFFTQLYMFLEHSVLSITHKKLPPSVDHFLASLQTHT